MVHARTIKEAASYFRETDPETCLTETAIRTLLRTGVVPSVRVGKKYLVSVEALETYLIAGTGGNKPAEPQYCAKNWQIR